MAANTRLLLAQACLLWLAGTIHYTLAATGTYLIVNDFHYDPTYETTQESCTKTVKADERGKFGDYNCDSPWSLVENAIKGMASKMGSPDFIVWNGDAPFHPKNKSNTVKDKDLVLETVENITALFKQHFPHTLVLPLLGNLDYIPKDQLPGVGTPGGFYESFANTWQDWLGTEVESFKKSGYFAKNLTNFHVIALNTNLYLKGNKAASHLDDPGDQYAWLRTKLDTIREEKSSAHLFLHVPAGVFESELGGGMFTETHNKKFIGILKDYSDVLVVSHAAHVHTDTFKLFYNDAGEAVHCMFLSPSVTPWRAAFDDRLLSRNPAFRQVDYDKHTGRIIDIRQYVLTLREINEDPRHEWRVLYSFRGAYNIQNVQPTSMQLVLENFKSYASDTFHRYYEYNHVDLPRDLYKPCSCECKTAHLCSIAYSDYTENDNCREHQSACDATAIALSTILLLLCLIFRLA